MSLSFVKQDENARPVAIISGGERDKAYIYLSETSQREAARAREVRNARPDADASDPENSDSDEDVPAAPSVGASDAEEEIGAHVSGGGGGGGDDDAHVPPPNMERPEPRKQKTGGDDVPVQARGRARTRMPPTRRGHSDDGVGGGGGAGGRKRPRVAPARPRAASCSTSSIALRPDEHVCPEPTHVAKARDLFYLSGQSGCGKSTMIKMIATRYRALWPKRHIVLISKLDEDETLPTGVPPLYVQRLMLDTLVTTKVELPELQNVLLLVDDVEGLPKEQAAAVQDLVDLVGNQGRHYSTSMVYASHMSTDYKRTRTLLMESQWYVFYPTATSASQLRHLLERYGGLDRAQVAAARKLPSRWVALRKIYPPLILYDGGAYILNAD